MSNVEAPLGLKNQSEHPRYGAKITTGGLKIPQAKPVWLPEMEEAALDALRNDLILRGENVAKFEEEFARYVGTDHAVAVASGTAALQFILSALAVEGRKVVTSPNSFIASANAIIFAGGKPVFADISDDDYCLDSAEAVHQVEDGAAALLPVHIYGHPFNLAGFEDMAKKRDTPIIEDACQAHGATYKGRKIGSLGVAAAFSFYPSKNMTVFGDGGMITTDDKRVAAVASKLRDCGRVSSYEHDVVGYTSRLSSASAAIGRVQLRHLDEWNEMRRRIAVSYTDRLADLAEVKTPPMGNNDFSPVFHQYVIRASTRDNLKSFLQDKGIQCGIHYPIPIHLQPLYRQLYAMAEGSYPKSEKLSRECLSLPMHPYLSAEEVDFVCDLIREYYEKSPRSIGPS